MADIRGWFAARLTREWLVHSLRTAVAAATSLLIARLFRLPEAYWAAITTIVVMQSTLGAALAASWQRFVGTALGAVAGALLAGYFGSSTVWFTAGVFALGLICALLGLERNAYRFAGITLAIVMLVGHEDVAWRTAIHRFVEVSVGIAVALVLTAIWPERATPGVQESH
ncbi:MAG TPA: FUSC family protein [Candidatus Acidoferrales bacterium]|nr:FUSC family protein [Candidatus Acidoferrales bacterium]